MRCRSCSVLLCNGGSSALSFGLSGEIGKKMAVLGSLERNFIEHSAMTQASVHESVIVLTIAMCFCQLAGWVKQQNHCFVASC